MKKIRFYKNTDYKSLIHLLKKNNMFDKVWENKKSIEKKNITDNKSIIVVVKKKNII